MILFILYIPLWESLYVSALNAKFNATTQAPTKAQKKKNLKPFKYCSQEPTDTKLMFFYTICVWKKQFLVLTSHKRFSMSKYKFCIN